MIGVNVRRKRTIEKAFRFSGSEQGVKYAKEFVKNAFVEAKKTSWNKDLFYLRIDTLCNGMREAYQGQWIIETSDGTYFIWPDSMFRARYDILKLEDK